MGAVMPIVVVGGGLAALYFLTKPSASTVNALAAKAMPIAQAKVSTGASIAAAAASAAAAIVKAFTSAPPPKSSTPITVTPTESEPGESPYAYSTEAYAD
jgi:hypothetical protein